MHRPARLSAAALRERSARAGESGDALGQDVALDLGRPGEERRGAIVEIRTREAPAGDRARPRLPAEAERAQELHQGVVHPLAHLAPEELHEARFRTERLAPLEARQRPPVVESRDLDLDPVLRDALPENGIVAARRRAAGALAGEADEILEQHAMDDELARRGAALVRER